MPLASTAISQVTTTSSMHCYLSHLLQDICACVLMHGPQLEFLVLILSTSLLSDVLRHSFMSKIADRAGALIHPLHRVCFLHHMGYWLLMSIGLCRSAEDHGFFSVCLLPVPIGPPHWGKALLSGIWFLLTFLHIQYTVILVWEWQESDLWLTHTVGSDWRNQVQQSAFHDRDCCHWHMRTCSFPTRGLVSRMQHNKNFGSKQRETSLWKQSNVTYQV